jgi:hypothetical protein
MNKVLSDSLEEEENVIVYFNIPLGNALQQGDVLFKDGITKKYRGGKEKQITDFLTQEAYYLLIK